MYSLRRYCFEWVTENPSDLSVWVWPTMFHFTYGQAVKRKIFIQKQLIKNFNDKNNPMRPHWMKQRAHWNKFKKAVKNGDDITIFKIKIR